MNRIICKIALVVALLCFNFLLANAQSAGDKLYNEGIKYQQTMTISSQRKAIEAFEQAQACYDSQSNKELCEQQIKTCKNTIALIKKNEKALAEAEEAARKAAEGAAAEPVAEEVRVRDDVTISFGDVVILEFGKKGDTKTVTVTCNYDDWDVVSAPDWVTCLRKDNELYIVVPENPAKEERSGSVKVGCDQTVESFVVRQLKTAKTSEEGTTVSNAVNAVGGLFKGKK